MANRKKVVQLLQAARSELNGAAAWAAKKMAKKAANPVRKRAISPDSPMVTDELDKDEHAEFLKDLDKDMKRVEQKVAHIEKVMRQLKDTLPEYKALRKRVEDVKTQSELEELMTAWEMGDDHKIGLSYSLNRAGRDLSKVDD